MGEISFMNPGVLVKLGEVDGQKYEIFMIICTQALSYKHFYTNMVSGQLNTSVIKFLKIMYSGSLN